MKKTKNSVIYFQFGLIATMLVALFVLEYSFQDVKKKEVCSFPGSIVEKDFASNEYKIISDPVVNPKPTPKPQIKVVTPQKVVTDFDVKDDEEVIKSNVDVASQDSKAVSDAPVSDTSDANDNGADVVKSKVVEPTFITVEQLPMFKACIGLSRAEQKACFETELSKVVSRHLVYPEDDFDDKKQGRAFVEFVIDEKGNVTNVNSLSNGNATEDMKRAAEKAVKRVPKLIPAQQGKKSVKIKYVIPISFKIN
ncbi:MULTISPECIES: energy transducer TonB [Flavobacterium]|uniref:Energy transducer TonB n=1 Tax=Flavobacterium jumunjinense TaxID=998845 RepID=A0ABV5GNB6_9FLAO|nr:MULTISPECIES: energy transducer TonB [Flavobacterium]